MNTGIGDTEMKRPQSVGGGVYYSTSYSNGLSSHNVSDSAGKLAAGAGIFGSMSIVNQNSSVNSIPPQQQPQEGNLNSGGGFTVSTEMIDQTGGPYSANYNIGAMSDHQVVQGQEKMSDKQQQQQQQQQQNVSNLSSTNITVGIGVDGIINSGTLNDSVAAGAVELEVPVADHPAMTRHAAIINSDASKSSNNVANTNAPAAVKMIENPLSENSGVSSVGLMQ